MKQFIIVLVLCAVAYAKIPNPFKNVTVNYTQLALGINQQLGLCTDTDAEACGGTILPALEAAENFVGAFQNLNLKLSLDYVNPLIIALQNYQTDCTTPINSYSRYFNEAYLAYQNDPAVFYQTVKANLANHTTEVAALFAGLTADLVAKNDVSAGVELAQLVQIAVSNYLPSDN